MENILSYTLDTSKDCFTIGKCKELDERPVQLKLYDHDAPYDLTGATLKLNILKNDGTFIIQTNNITASENVITINPLSVDATRVPGITQLELSITKNGLAVTTFTFNLIVLPSVMDSAVQSGNIITILEELNAAIASGQVTLNQAEQAITDLNNLIINGGAVKTVDYNADKIAINNAISANANNLTASIDKLDTVWITDYNVDLTGVADCTSQISQAIADAVATGKRRVYFPSGIYNGGMNNKNSNMDFIMGTDVTVDGVWHYAVGSSNLVPTNDPNYATTDSYVENVRIIGKIKFSNNGRLGTFMCKNCFADSQEYSGDNYGGHFYYGTENLTLNEIKVNGNKHYNGNTGAVFVDNMVSVDVHYRPKNITINKLIIDAAYLHGFYAYDVDGLTIKELVITGSNVGLVDAHNVYIKNCKKVKIDKIESASCLGTNTFGVKLENSDCNIGTIDTGYNQRGIFITGSGNTVTIEDLNTHNNANYGLQCGGNMFLVIKKINGNANLGHCIFVTGNTGTIIIGNGKLDGTAATTNYTTGAYYTNSNGVLIMDKVDITGFNTPNGKGVYCDSVTGKTIIKSIMCHGNGEGFNINNVNCTGFLINEIQAWGNTVRDFAPLPADTIKGLGVPTT
jgi:hypothetical protein